MTPDLMRDFESDQDYQNYSRASEFDPRLVAVVSRDDYAHAPDDEGMAPTCVIGDYTSADADLYAIVHNAWWHYHDHDLVARYLRMFHGAISVDWQNYGQRDEATIYAVVTAEWAESMGITRTGTPGQTLAEWAESATSATLAEWKAYNDGDVYSVGILLNRDHTLPFEPSDELPTNEGDGWEWFDTPVHGYYGDDVAALVAIEDLTHAARALRESEPLICM